ncbi:glycine dehydrogenase (aminomethyl-transferring) [Candidatus Wirthbacteria bacterium CG2_30_54_11]|uniref:Probable glycine dehydrogenase (decarboxylating) subunit 1 n=1 Tax=Candidatus Wirthbacteria bacterium CG2_30_54_11 TaxID=1817892 RepID=A0A1J5IWE7_9BACT|nr:MAG: glycine dehydrogenase (aminomethyl-transferring) [Candidatus Wirthbacteria bacterium CG2_30_54_11]
MDYVPHTTADQQKMLRAVGVGSVDALFADIPEKYRLKDLLKLPAPLTEQEVSGLMASLASSNTIPGHTFMGAGAYHHFIPAVVGHVIGRSEFYTAYTPYQAEISQGILQAIYEYQSMIAGLTGMQVANASMYDGASAMAEAAVLTAKTLRRTKIVVARSVHPEYRGTTRTYCWSNGYEVVEVGYDADGQIDKAALTAAVDDNTAAVLVQSPNFFGVIEDIAAIEPAVHAKGAALVVGFTEAISLGMLKPAGVQGADIVVGEGQSFGNPLNYGGPYLGVFTSSEKYMRKIPGRIVGETLDRNGKRGYVLTLQAREQHIRREKATSNICSNEALCMLAAAVYMVSLGKNLKPLAELNYQKAEYLKDRLASLPGWKPVFSGPTFNEFVMQCPDAKGVNAKLKAKGILGGYEAGKDYADLNNSLVFCATEMVSRADIDQVIEIVK